jgi:hypothetical protein
MHNRYSQRDSYESVKERVSLFLEDSEAQPLNDSRLSFRVDTEFTDTLCVQSFGTQTDTLLVESCGT